VNEDDFADTGRADLVAPARDGGQVQIADWAASEAAKLQMHQVLRVGNLDFLAGDADEFAAGQTDLVRA
jgi:hypothetical protein